MFGSIKARAKRAIKGGASRLYRLALKWDADVRPRHEREWLLSLEGALTPAMKERLDGEAFEEAHGYSIRWGNPRSFNEKIMWGLLHYQNPLLVRCNDKFSVKGYVDEVLGPGHIAEVYGWWTDPDDIEFDKLPERFALKVNWSSGGFCNIYVPDKRKIDEAEIRARLRPWLEPSFSVHYYSFRWDAQFDSPVIYAEEYLPAEAGFASIQDYKLNCYHGACLNVMVGASTERGYCANWYDRDWNPLSIDVGSGRHLPSAPAKPKHFDQMLAIAEKLARPFPYIRVDLYEVGDRVMVGEMTFAFGGGRCPIRPREMDFALGEPIDMPEFVNFDRLREYDPLPPERAYLLDGKISPEVTRREMERRFLTKLLYWPNLENPCSLNEKLLWTALHWNGTMAKTLADRCEMRRFVAEAVGERYLVPEIGVYTDANQIDWSALPERFAAKSGARFGKDSIYLVRHKSCDSEGVFKATVGDWLLPWNASYYYNACLPGRKTEPKILIEAWVGGEAKRLNEYRFYCSFGEAKLACAVCERGTERESCTFAEPDTWEALPLRLHDLHKRPSAEKPEKLAEMLRLCEELTRELPLVRVDFFEAEGQVYVHGIGLDCAFFWRIEPVEWDYRLGERFVLGH